MQDQIGKLLSTAPRSLVQLQYAVAVSCGCSDLRSARRSASCLTMPLPPKPLVAALAASHSSTLASSVTRDMAGPRGLAGGRFEACGARQDGRKSSPRLRARAAACLGDRLLPLRCNPPPAARPCHERIPAAGLAGCALMMASWSGCVDEASSDHEKRAQERRDGVANARGLGRARVVRALVGGGA